ncbi:FAD:protein FMN transferase [Ignavibacterium album]|uniref:FAD:protein FMN transferase n=1 Tax=Ignavibacterium album TaxID=591197 RepID=UPI0035B930AE
MTKLFEIKKSILGWAGIFIVLFLIGFFISKNSSDEIKTIKRTQILLGTVVEIQVRDTDEQKADDAITKAFAEIKRIDDLFTTYNEESPVSKINNSSDTVLKIDEEIYKLLVLCDSVTKISYGCFDLSLDNLTRVWGFYTDNPNLPTKTEIDSALMKSGWKNVKLIGNDTIIKKKNVGLNFGAIAKGYAVDKAIDILRTSGIESALVNAGGEIKVIGKNWRVGIQHPRDERDVIAVVKPDNNSVATSGDYEQFFEVDEIRYHHILDPKSGYPAKGLRSVTIINQSNTFADALATAVFVMGKDKGMRLIENLSDTEAMIIDSEGKIFYSSGFEKFLIN